MFEKLFEPITIGGVKIKNRLFIPPMVVNFCETDGFVNEKFIKYHEERAKGVLWSSIIVTLGSINLRCKSLLKRSKIVIIGVRSQVVVPNKDIATHGMIQLIVRAELMLINQFLLEGMIESLYRSIIIRTAGFTHTLRNPT